MNSKLWFQIDLPRAVVAPRTSLFLCKPLSRLQYLRLWFALLMYIALHPCVRRNWPPLSPRNEACLSELPKGDGRRRDVAFQNTLGAAGRQNLL